MKKLLITTALILASPAYAQSPDYLDAPTQMTDGEARFYVGIGYNAYEFDGYTISGRLGSATGSLTVPKVDIDGFELTLGYRFTEIISGEFNYGKLEGDDFDASATITINSSTTTDDFPYLGPDVDTLKLSALFHVPNDKFRPFARVGYYDADVDDRTFGIDDETISLFDTNDDGLLWGLGIDFALPSKITLRAEYQDADETGGFNIAAMYRF